MWRGRLSLRWLFVLINGLPPGSGLGRVLGGDRYWSPVEAATIYALWRVECQIRAAAGGKQRDMPDRPKPPEEGWQEKARAKQEREQAKAASWLARHPELGLHV